MKFYAVIRTCVEKSFNPFSVVSADNSVALAIAFCSFLITVLLIYGAITVSLPSVVLVNVLFGNHLTGVCWGFTNQATK